MRPLINYVNIYMCLHFLLRRTGLAFGSDRFFISFSFSLFFFLTSLCDIYDLPLEKPYRCIFYSPVYPGFFAQGLYCYHMLCCGCLHTQLPKSCRVANGNHSKQSHEDSLCEQVTYSKKLDSALFTSESDRLPLGTRRSSLFSNKFQLKKTKSEPSLLYHESSFLVIHGT